MYTLLCRACVHSILDVCAFSGFRSLMFFIYVIYVIYVIYLTGFSTRPVCLAGGYTVSAVSRFEPHSYCHPFRMIRGGGGGVGGGGESFFFAAVRWSGSGWLAAWPPLWCRCMRSASTCAGEPRTSSPLTPHHSPSPPSPPPPRHHHLTW